MNNELKSVEDIDSMLVNNFKIDTNTQEDIDNTEENDTDTVSDEEKTLSTDVETEKETDDSTENDEKDSNDEDKSQNDGEKPKEQEKDKVKLTDDDKKEYSFAKIRKENSDLKSQIKASTAMADFLKNMAIQNGYSDVDKFIQAYNDAAVIQEAKDKGYDPVLYKQLQDSNSRISKLEQEKAQDNLSRKATAFRDAVEKAVTDYTLGEDGKDIIFTRLEEAGYDVNSILSLPNPEIVIKGVLADKIAEVSKQKQISKLENINNLTDEKHDSSSTTKDFNLDAIIAEEMKEFKANQL